MIIRRIIRRLLRGPLADLIGENTAELRESMNRLARVAGISREQAMGLAFEFCAKSDVDGAYLEFGCAEGESLIRAYRAYTFWLEYCRRHNRRMCTRKLIAFDSFEGLPEPGPHDCAPGYNVFSAGQYSCSREKLRGRLEREGVDLGDVALVPGFYHESLNEEAVREIGGQRAAVVHIDCDLYESARLALDFVTPFLQDGTVLLLDDFLQDGTVLLLDDFLCHRANPRSGVRRAFREWKGANAASIELTMYFRYSWAGSAFIVNTADRPTPVEGAA